MKGEGRPDSLHQVGPDGAFRLGRMVVVKLGGFGLEGHLSIWEQNGRKWGHKCASLCVCMCVSECMCERENVCGENVHCVGICE